MLSNNLLKLDLSQATVWQTLRRWRWWVAIGCAVLGYGVEQFERQLEIGLDAVEILAYSLLLPLLIWLIMTWLAHALSERAGAVAARAQHQQILEQLDKHLGWDELIQYVTRLPAVLLPIKRAKLYMYDYSAGQFQLTADSNITSHLIAQRPDHTTCKACESTRQPHYRSGFSEYCQPLTYDNLLIGVLRVQFRPEALIDQHQLQFLNMLAPQIALALGLAFAQPQHVTQLQTQARLNERRHLAYELHDSLAQHLGYLHLALDRLTIDEPLPTELLRQELINLREVSGDAYRQVRDQLTLLRAQHGTDLIQSLRSYVQLTARRSQVRMALVAYGQPPRLPAGLHAQIFGLVRESLNNVQRHANAYEAQVILYWDDDLVIVAVTDDGVGFDAAAQRTSDHHGLAMLHERIDSLNGQLHIHSAHNRGTRLIFYVPLDHAPTEPASLLVPQTA
jgi:signal transduction histidine kinase